MRLNSINNIKNSPNYQLKFKGNLADSAVNTISKHPGIVAALAGSSVIAQKIVMSGSEAVVGSAMDVAMGKTITAVTKEKDGRTNESSKKQAIRTFSQSVGGTIVGVAVRALCIGGATYLCSKAGGEIASTVAQKGNKFLEKKNASAWGKSIGGAVAIGVMLFTNFLIDAPLINKINNKVTQLVNNKDNNIKENKAKEAK